MDKKTQDKLRKIERKLKREVNAVFTKAYNHPRRKNAKLYIWIWKYDTLTDMVKELKTQYKEKMKELNNINKHILHP